MSETTAADVVGVMVVWLIIVLIGVGIGTLVGRRSGGIAVEQRIRAEAISAGVAEYAGVDEDNEPVFKWKECSANHQKGDTP